MGYTWSSFDVYMVDWNSIYRRNKSEVHSAELVWVTGTTSKNRCSHQMEETRFGVIQTFAPGPGFHTG